MDLHPIAHPLCARTLLCARGSTAHLVFADARDETVIKVIYVIQVTKRSRDARTAGIEIDVAATAVHARAKWTGRVAAVGGRLGRAVEPPHSDQPKRQGQCRGARSPRAGSSRRALPRPGKRLHTSTAFSRVMLLNANGLVERRSVGHALVELGCAVALHALQAQLIGAELVLEQEPAIGRAVRCRAGHKGLVCLCCLGGVIANTPARICCLSNCHRAGVWCAVFLRGGARKKVANRRALRKLVCAGLCFRLQGALWARLAVPGTCALLGARGSAADLWPTYAGCQRREDVVPRPRVARRESFTGTAHDAVA
jgi:hypothetical protein